MIFLATLLKIFVQLHQLGHVLPAPVAMRAIPNGNAREPDILFLATEHLDRLTETELNGPADLVIEVILTESMARDRGDKFYEYQEGACANIGCSTLEMQSRIHSSMSTSDKDPIDSTVLLIHHSANRGRHYPPSSLQGLKACLDARARVVEVDVIPLVGGDFALFHDERLEHGTDGEGDVISRTALEVSRLHHVWQGTVSDMGVGLLSQAITLMQGDTHLQELQLDLKAYGPLTDEVLENLLRLIEPVKHQVRVTCVADWAVRRLRALDPDVQIGFDPLLYFDVQTTEREAYADPPFRVGAYGYRDDHPLAARAWGTVVDYLAARADALHAQVPANTMWYIDASVLAATLDAGFDWIGYLHGQGAQVAAWTLDAQQPADVVLARRLVAMAVDRITTNDAPAMSLVLDSLAEF